MTEPMNLNTRNARRPDRNFSVRHHNAEPPGAHVHGVSGEGTTFQFWLPRTSVPALLADAFAAGGPGLPAGPGSPGRPA